MITTSFHDVQQLSASLDGQLSRAEKTRLEARIRSNPALTVIEKDLRQARDILRRTPNHRLPRNFTLTPGMAGIKPPVPRLVPAFSWASAVAMLMFVVTFGSSLLGQISFGAAAPMQAAAPMPGEGYGFGGGPAATQPPAADNTTIEPTPESFVLMAPEATPPVDTNRMESVTNPDEKSKPEGVNIWLFIWLGLALVLIAAALLIRRASVLAFHRNAAGKHNS